MRKLSGIQRPRQCRGSGFGSKSLESLCKYAARPPLAHKRLQETSGGRLVYRMKTPWRSGQTHVAMERIELIEKLAALVPRPRYHIVHHYGVLAPAVLHDIRQLIVRTLFAKESWRSGDSQLHCAIIEST
jgi:hypothetical protein